MTFDTARNPIEKRQKCHRKQYTTIYYPISCCHSLGIQSKQQEPYKSCDLIQSDDLCWIICAQITRGRILLLLWSYKRLPWKNALRWQWIFSCFIPLSPARCSFYLEILYFSLILLLALCINMMSWLRCARVWSDLRVSSSTHDRNAIPNVLHEAPNIRVMSTMMKKTIERSRNLRAKREAESAHWKPCI